MKKKNTFIGVALLIAILMLGIGYASSTLDLNITGTATGVEAPENFKVVFKSADAGNLDQEYSANVKSVAVLEDATMAEMSVELGIVGDKASATFVIENQSANGIAAKLTADNVKILDMDNNEYNSEYFDIELDWVNEDVTLYPATEGEEAESFPLVVTVTLKKAVIGETEGYKVTENFQVVLEDIESAAA